jgi:hypothetical protein
MFKQASRGKGKIKTDLGNIHLYRFYRKINKGKNPVDIATFRAVITDLNQKIVDRIILESEEFKMPYRLGKIYIKKLDLPLGKIPKNKWPIDYERSRKLGFIVYHDNDDIFRWKWNKRNAIVTNRSFYMFKPSRHNKRYLAKALKTLNKDYFG